MNHNMSVFNPGSPDSRLSPLLADYPSGLFSTKFHASCELADRYGLELAIHLVKGLGIAARLDSWRSLDELFGHLKFDKRFRTALVWLLQRLRVAGLLLASQRDGCPVYRLGGKLRAPQLDALRHIGLSIDRDNAATLDLLDAAAAVYPSVAFGEASGEEALFSVASIGLWLRYFSNDNPLYAINNWIAAIAAAKRLAKRPKLCILEIGAGAGSGTEALLKVMTERGLDKCLERYVVTEPNTFFRRRSERELKKRYAAMPVEFASLDIDKPWDEQGVEQGGFHLVYGVNVLHVAQDLAFSLRAAQASLAAGGWMVAGEGMRPFPQQPLWAELMFQILDGFISVSTNTEYRPNPGFLTAEQWQMAFARSEFSHVEVTPDHARIREIYPRFFTGAICGRMDA